MPQNRAKNAAAAALPRPDLLTLELSVQLNSTVHGEPDGSGWEVWVGDLTAFWWFPDDDGAGPVPSGTRGWNSAEPEEVDEGGVRLKTGQLEAWLLRLNEPHAAFTEVGPIDSSDALFDAADAISQDLHDAVAPVLGTDGGLFREEVADLTDTWFDQLVVLREIEVHHVLRGFGAGAWAAARALTTLARDEGTLIVAKAAPLRRSDFLTGPVAGEHDPHRDLTPAETAAWNRRQASIAAHWQRTLGLRPLRDHPNILVGTGGVEEHRRSTLQSWS